MLCTDDAADKVINLKHIFFEDNSSQLDDKSNKELDNLAKILKNYEGVTVEISGHTDNVGDTNANITLSSESKTLIS